LASKDFSFVVEENLSDIFKHFAEAGIRINIMQNSAINFSVSVDEVSVDLEALILRLQEKYQVKYNSNLSLLTIRHYTNDLIGELTQNKEIILEQRTRNTVRFLLRD
jgi:aspartate kinase